MRITEEDNRGRDEKECEGRRGWMTGGRARMASSETGVARSYLIDGERARSVCSSFSFQCNVMFALGFWWFLHSRFAAFVGI